MYLKSLVIPIAVLTSSIACAQEVGKNVHEACNSLTINQQSVPSELQRFLGKWDECRVEYYKEGEFGSNALIIVRWDGVKLSVEYQPPEAAIHTVEVTGINPLTSEWYEKNKKNLINDFFDMNFERDEFPGPTSEYYLSPEVGTNAQFWVERDKDGNVTWMRFSYAL